MYSYITGTIVEKNINGIVLDCNGIGYDILVSSFTLDKISKNNTFKIFTYYKVAEDGVTLFGFYSKEEKEVFLKLISVNGVGAKIALGILSTFSPLTLLNAIAAQDVKLLSKAKGVGKKMAERIVLELKDKVEFDGSDSISITPSNLDNDSKDAIEALKGLGVSYNEAYRVVTKVKDSAKNIEELIFLALKSIN